MNTETVDAVQLLRRRVDRLVATRDRLRDDHRATEAQIEPLRQSVADHTQATTILTKVSAAHRKLSVSRIERLVTASLQAVFERPYEFRVSIEEKRGQVEAAFSVKEGDLELDPTSEMGGGVVDVISITLRVVLWSKRRKRTEAIMAMDEPARMVAEEYIKNVAMMIKKLSGLMSIQFLLVTHRDALAEAADRTFRVRKDTASRVTVEG